MLIVPIKACTFSSQSGVTSNMCLSKMTNYISISPNNNMVLFIKGFAEEKKIEKKKKKSNKVE